MQKIDIFAGKIRKAIEEGQLKAVPMVIRKNIQYKMEPLPKVFYRTLITTFITMVLLLTYACWRIHVEGASMRESRRLLLDSMYNDSSEEDEEIIINYLP